MKQALLWTAVILVVADATLQPVLGRDTDMWWILAAGREICDQGRLPLVDHFSFTHEGATWYRIHWLYELAAYAVYRVGGLDGVVLIRTALAVGAFAMLAAAARARGASALAAAVAVVFGASIGMRYSFIRPHFLTLFMASGFILLLERARADVRAQRWLWLLPVLLVVWFNCHGGALVGIALTGVYGTADLIERWRGVREGPAPRWFVLLPLLAAALFISPQPFDFVAITLRYSFFPDDYSRTVTEAQPFVARENISTLVFLALTLPSVVASLRARRVLDALLVLAFSTLIFRSTRHQYLFVPLLVPVAASSLDLLLRPLLPLARPATRTVAAVALVVVSAWTLLDIAHTASPPSRLIRWETLPEAPAAFLRANNVRGRMFNDFNWSGYLIWRLTPDDRVYIDSRSDQVYDLEAFHRYFDLLLGKPGTLEAFDRLGIDIVVENHLMSGSALFRTLLPASPAWWKAYDDGASRIWLRRAAVPTAAAPGGTFMDFYRSGTILEATDPVAAERAFEQALLIYPDFAVAHLHLGVVQARQGNLTSAVVHWRRAVELNPEMATAHLDLGLASEQLGDPAGASCEFAQVLALEPDNALARARLDALPPPSWCGLRGLWRRLLAPLSPLP